MLRNILGALALFIAISLLAVYLARMPAEPHENLAPEPVPVTGAVTLLPPGDFTPRRALPAVAVQAQGAAVTLQVYHIRDHALLLRLYRGVEQDTLSPVALARLLAEKVPPVAVRTLPLVKGAANFAWKTLLPTLPPGLYAVTAASDPAGPAVAATWFLRTDLQATVAEDQAGWRVLCQNMATGAPEPAARVAWYGIGANPALGESDCRAGSEPQLVRGDLAGNDLPQLVLAEDQQGNIALVSLREARLASPQKSTRAFLATDRAHYLPGQKLGVLAIGLAGDHVRLALMRPDGLRLREQALADWRAHNGWQSFVLPDDAPPGDWQVTAVGEDGTRTSVTFRVGQVAAPEQARLRLVERDGAQTTVVAMLEDAQGQPRHDQAASIMLRWENARQLPGVAADYAFGGYDAPDLPEQMVAGLVTASNNTLRLTLPPPPELPYPVQAQLRLQPVGPGPVESQPLALPFAMRPWALGLKAEFQESKLRGNDKANFRVALFKTGNSAAPAPEKLDYELVTERRSYRWFFADGRWDYKTDVATAPVLHDSVPLDNNRRGLISVPVQRGQYRLDVFTPERKLVTSWRFQADTPPSAAPAAANEPLPVARSGSVLELTPRDSAVTAIAADDAVRAFAVFPAGKAAQLPAPLADGGQVITLAAQSDEDGRWQLRRGLAWVPPAPLPARDAAALVVPPVLVADSATPFTATVPLKDDTPFFAQLVAVPLAAGATPAPLLAARDRPRARQTAITSNLPFDWPAEQETPPPAAPPVAAASSFSPIVALTGDGDGLGKAELPLVLPRHQGAVALHLLLWHDKDSGEVIRTVNLAPPIAPAAPPALAKPAPPAIKLPPVAGWTCHEPLAAEQGLSLPPPSRNAPPGFAVIGPLPVPDMTALLGQLLELHSLRSDVLARSLQLVPDYENLLTARGIDAAALATWQSQAGESLLERQQGDGGIALYPAQKNGNLAASAAALLAWERLPPLLATPERQAALQDYLKRRLDVAWNAENELFGRTDAFYALSRGGKADASALRYFVEKYGNTIRHAVYEAELAAALQAVQDNDQSRAFAARALAQLPSLRVEQPMVALQVMALLAQHDLASAAELTGRLRGMKIPSSTASLTALGAAPAWVHLARHLPAWQAQIGDPIVGHTGLYGKALDGKTPLTIKAKSKNGLHVCTVTQAAKVPETPPALKRQLFTANGTPLRKAWLTAGSNYVLLVSAQDVPAGVAELDVPLPAGLSFRAAVPGGPVAGQYAWLKQVEGAVAAQADAAGVTLALERANAGELRLALIVAATAPGKNPWPPAQLAQPAGLLRSAADTLVIE